MRGDSHLKIHVTRTFEVSTVARISEDDTRATNVVEVSSSGDIGSPQPPTPGLCRERYRPRRHSDVYGRGVLKTTDGRTDMVNLASCIGECSEELSGKTVLKVHHPTWRDTQSELFAWSDTSHDRDSLNSITYPVELLGNKDDIETTLDEIVMKPRKILAIARSWGIWMFKIQFYDSTLSPDWYDGLLICGLPASSFTASCDSTAEGYYRVKWNPQWQDSVPSGLGFGRTIRSKLAIIASPMDNLLWRADSAMCTINGRAPTYHLCMESDCFECELTIRAKSRRTKAEEFLLLALRASQEHHPDDLPEMAKAVSDLAHYENPLKQLFIATDGRLSHHTSFVQR